MWIQIPYNALIYYPYNALISQYAKSLCWLKYLIDNKLINGRENKMSKWGGTSFANKSAMPVKRVSSLFVPRSQNMVPNSGAMTVVRKNRTTL